MQAYDDFAAGLPSDSEEVDDESQDEEESSTEEAEEESDSEEEQESEEEKPPRENQIKKKTPEVKRPKSLLRTVEKFEKQKKNHTEKRSMKNPLTKGMNYHFTNSNIEIITYA